LTVSYVEEKCPSCGGPLPHSADWLVCKFCGAELKPAPGAQYHIWPKTEDPPFAPEKPRVSISGVRFCVLGQLGRGEVADVLLARRDSRVTEMVVIKMARDGSDVSRLGREWSAIADIASKDREGDVYFRRMLPQPVVNGLVDGSKRVASVFRWRSGFQWTFDDLLVENKAGVDPRAGVWLWKRVLDMLGWVHRGGWAHGSIAPAQLLVHPRDHGVAIVGWSRAVKGGSPSDDIGASARAVATVLGAGSVPAPIANLVREQSTTPAEDAWTVKEKLDQAAFEAYGPPKYHRFQIAGWG
jgi:hypothetical protein